MNNLCIDQTIRCVRKIVENIQCTICDKIEGSRLRYACGHTACDDCVIDAVDCQLCLTPPQVSSPQPMLDDALTQRVKNASGLLKVCQDLFNTDVFKHNRLSEQLRIEKELFPECIQAPVKYENKRKTAFLSYKNKENRNTTFFPGEDTSLSSKNNTMDSSAKIVQQWLNKTGQDFTRKPFRDLNVNTQLYANIKDSKSNYPQIEQNQNVSVLNSGRKRSHFKTTVKNNSLQCRNVKSIANKHNGISKKVKKHLSNVDPLRIKTKTKCDIDESGIFMEDDPIVIDDSQETVIDKDKSAWLAVLKANENEEIESTSVVNPDCLDSKTLIYTNKETATESGALQSKTKPNIKIPFYKKSYIMETCTYCNAEADKAIGKPEKVEIIIDNTNFTTTIQILKDVENHSKLNITNSVSVQTDTCESFLIDNLECTNFKDKDGTVDIVSQNSEIQSEDLFEEEGQNIGMEYKQKNPNDYLVIAESDSDMEMDSSGPLPVKVDVHRSCDESEYGILSEIVNTDEHNTRKRRGPRGLTPTSTDSSDKENYNPNRMKRHTSKKKKCTKK